MRKTLIAALLALPVCALAGERRTVVLDLQNMTCALCSVTVQKALHTVAGVADAKISFEQKTATVTFDPGKVTPAALVKATTDAGFPSSPHGTHKP